jgi:hypothetical protein
MRFERSETDTGSEGKTLSSLHALDGASGDSISSSAAGNISSDCSQPVTRKEVTLGA